MYSQAVQQTPGSISRLDKLAAFLRAEPDNLPLQRECVELAMASGEYTRALEFVEARLARHPQEAESLFARSNALIGLKQYADALAVLQALEQQGVTNMGVLQNLATCHYLMQQYQAARTYTDRLVAAGETSAGTLLVAISSLHHLGEVEPALMLADAHAAVLESEPRLAGAAALLYSDDNQIDKATRLATASLARNPDNVDALTVMSTLASANLDVARAEQGFHRVLELAPNSGRAWLGLGLLATLAQDFRQAQEWLARATELMPRHLGSWHARGWAHLFAGDQAGAEQMFAHALDLDRNFAESHGAMAAMLAFKGDRAGAEREIEFAERLDRAGLSSQFARAVLLNQAQGAQASRDFIFKAVRLAARRVGGRAEQVLEDLARGR